MSNSCIKKYLRILKLLLCLHHSLPFHLYPSLCLPLVKKPYCYRTLRKQPLCLFSLFSPFYYTDALSVNIFFQPHLMEFPGAGNPVEVYMVKRQPSPFVYIKDSEARALYVTFHTKPFCNALGKPGFPASKLSDKRNAIAFP